MRSDVTVVVPTYNQADFLGEALRSVIAQDFAGWRAIVVNNHSTDGTREVVASIDDPRIELVDFANHGIIAASRNVGIERADSEFVAFLDSDDWWSPTKLSRCVTALGTEFDVVCHAEEWRSASGSRVVRYGPANRSGYRELLLGGNCLSTSAVVGRTETFRRLGGFSVDPRFVTAEDYDLWLRVAQSGGRFRFIDDVLGVFRIHGSSASSAVDRNVAAEMAVVEHHLSRAAFAGRAVRRRREARSHYAAGRAHHAAGNDRAALRRLLRSVRLNPLFPRVHAALVLAVVSAVRRAVPIGRGSRA